MRVGLVHPGEMGAAIGAMLVEHGHAVLWHAEGRSEQTARRAAAAGLTEVDGWQHAEVILSGLCGMDQGLGGLAPRRAEQRAGEWGGGCPASGVEPLTTRSRGTLAKRG